jgi:hypothetical protein
MAEADLERSIPSSMVDGLKPGQRKVLFCSFKRNLIEETKVRVPQSVREFILWEKTAVEFAHLEPSIMA